ncbi:hypothetical protein ACFO6R_13320 [Eubacterium multiforme]|uniref:Uncharacterized Zn finger protein (UPF0148 family) n=1 Tax=Eubacterium multiforme TaxID=83339 RepID=A0ABT9UXX7_9FIRM|nr:hypothetical protein [Eubacterium multiforme]MDQ0151176.1 uncharacterized Zn finger protein (UPF0148 family) [Eubacterium multiforme]
MDKLECPRCKNEKLKGTENYCPICGLNLKGGMTKEEVIGQIDSLIDEAKLHIEDDPFDSEVFRDDKEALETVKEVYKRTAQEVPVQEQPKFIPESSNGICEYPNRLTTPKL